MSDNFVCLAVCLCAFVLPCTLDLGYIFQQGGVSPWLNPYERWSGSAKILPVSQIFLSIQHNFCPSNFTRFSLYAKAGDTVQVY